MKYLFYFLLWIQENLRSKAKGGMQPFIPLSFFRTEVLIPIPPSEEQFKIISNIEEILSKIDSLEKNKIDLENIIKQAKSKDLIMSSDCAAYMIEKSGVNLVLLNLSIIDNN